MQSQTILRSTLQSHLHTLSQSNRYEKLLIFLMSIIWLLSTFVSNIGPFMFMNPVFICNGVETFQVEACAIYPSPSCHIENDYTATYYCELFCESEFERSMVQSAFFIGCIVGMLTLVPISDRKGRKSAIIIAFICEIVGICLIISGIYLKTWLILWIGQFLCGVFNSCVSVTSYVITGQFCNDKLRQQSIMLYCAMWGFGEMCFLPIYYLLKEWYNFAILFILLPSIGIFLVCLFFIYEAPSFWLFNSRNYQKFEQSLHQLALYNDITQQKIQQITNEAKVYLQTLQTSQTGPVSPTSISSILCKKTNLKICLCIAVSQSAFNVYYYSMQNTMQRTGFNFGISMFLAGLHQFIGYLIARVVVSRIPRKKGLVITIIISSLVGLSLVFQWVKSSYIVESVVISIARFCTVFGYSFIAMLQTQSFQAQIKSTGVGVTDGLSQISKVIVPYIVNSLNNIGVHPLIVSSAVYLVIGIGPILFIKQTLTRNQVAQHQQIKQQIGSTEDSEKKQERSNLEGKLLPNQGHDEQFEYNRHSIN